ncbi:MAG: murein biosynthesis integral membrane protein MurJ [Candidatus Omnitrophica bacterium]|nr:murein biosynthesis integral membrane protein MurJ [Candidatus Omnitrophota bacterium]
MSNNKSQGKDSPRSLIRSTSIISLGTLSSRILGFVRDIVLARFFGTGFKADAFFVAFKIPNLFRDFVGEGATNAAIVPVFSEYLVKKSEKEYWEFVSVILVLALVVLSAITLTGVMAAPLIVRVIAPGFMHDPAKLELTIQLTKMMFPYLVFIGMTAYSIAILFTFRSFTVPAFSPCLMNLAIIISALLSARYLKEPVYGLAGGVLVGGVLQLLAQIRPLRKCGMRFHRPKTLRHPGARQVGRLLVPRVFGAGVYQLTVLIDTFCASLSSVVGAGGISAIYYSNRIIQFPMGLFGFALASAVLPALSGFASQQNIDQVKKTLTFALGNIFFIMIPISLMTMVLAHPIIRILFQRGEFSSYSTSITSMALLFYASGLFSFGGLKIMITAFHALQDTKTPVKAAALCLVINAVLNFILMYPMKVAGIALASAIAASIDFFILYYVLNKRLSGISFGPGNFIFKIFFASALSGLFVFGAWRYLPPLNDIVKLMLVGLSGLALYGAICYTLQVEQAQKIYLWVVNKK